MSIQSSNSAPGSPLSSASVSAQIESGEPDISRISLGERDNEDVDVEMNQAEVPPPNNANLGSSSLGIHLPNAPAVSSGSVSSSSTASRNPIDVAKSLVTKRDHYLSLLNDMIVGTADDDANGQQHMVEIRNKIEELNRTISTIKHSVKLSSERVAASIKGVLAGSSNATTGGISLSKRDLPKFQLKSDSVKYFHGEESFDSIFHFLAVFEKVVSSSGQDVESVWKRYLPLTIPYEYDMWLKQELLLVNTWKEAKDAFVKKFNSSLHRLSARRAVQSAIMQGGETTEQYLNRFSRSCVEAGYDSNDAAIADAFLNGFPTDWQIQITALLCNTFPGQDSWTTNQVAGAATNILGNVKRPMSFVGRAAEANSNHSKGASGGGKFGGQQQGFRAKRENTQNSESTFSRDKEGGKRNVPSGATRPTFCLYCGKRWVKGHSCPEYHAAMKANGGQKPTMHVLSIKKSKAKANKKKRHHHHHPKRNNNVKSNSDHDEETNWLRQAYENQNDCKYEKQKKDHSFNLITPLLINDTRIIGKVDPGSDISIINKSVLNKEFSSIKNIKAMGGYLMFLGNNKDGKPNSIKRIGKTEPMTITYMNGIKFEHAFEIIDFNDTMAEEFDVLLGVDILPKLRIYLSGVAHCWADDRDKEKEQFKNINYDNDNAYNPENANYGSPKERDFLMKQIEDALEANKNIPPDAVCTMPESVVHIPISDPKDCYARQYPLAINAHKEIEKQIKEWLENKIVERCKPSSVFHSPLLAVGKKDENNNVTKLRICCDLRKINAAIDKDYHENLAIPKIQEIFERVSASARIISKVDLHQAYHAYEVDRESRNALIFSHNGLFYRWCRAPFGLSFMSSKFVKNMSILLEGIHLELQHEMEKRGKPRITDLSQKDDLNQRVVYGGVEHYLDDMVLHTVDLQSHIVLINLVLKRLTKVNLKINAAKCSWFQTSVFLLGFVVGPGVTKLDMRRLSNVDEWPIPTTAKQVRSIMGVVSFMRDYAPMLSKVAEPIDRLRNDHDVKHNWTQLHTDRFNAIKQILVSNQILHAPDLNAKMYLQGDASLCGIAACLYQKDELGRIKHIGFVSRSLSESERNWSTNRRECAAIVFGIVKFKSLLWGHPNIEVLTDHLALTFMFTSTGLNSTLQSYLEILGEYSFTIAHVKGIENVLCDAMSRLYPPIEEDKRLEDETDRQIRKLQKLILIKRAANKQQQLVKETTFYSKDKTLNVLAIKLNDKAFKQSTTDYVCPPENERAQIIKEAHELGHFGEASVVAHIHTYHGLHWNSIYADVKEILKSCRECAQHNISKKGFNPAKSIVSFEAFDHVAVDLLGPLHVTDKGNVYCLVLLDLCTRYVILRALPNKNSSTVAQCIMDIFGDYGVALTIFQSDNGKEFRNHLMRHFLKTLSIKQHFSLPYYKQSNGGAENAIKTATQTVRKMCGNDSHNWDDKLSMCQLVMNMKVKTRTASTPFSLMFARQVNTRRETDKLNLNGRTPLSMEELQERIKYMNDIVFPAIQERTKRLAEEYNKKLDGRRMILEDIPFDSAVMIRLPEGRQSKLSPLYAGPYIVVRRTQAGNYILKDETNELLHREYTPSELKLVNIDETAIENEIFEVEEIRDHRTRPDGIIEYLVKWAGYEDRYNEYITEDLFSTPVPIQTYWEKIRQVNQNKNTGTNKRSTTSKTNRRGRKRTAGEQSTPQAQKKRK